MGSAGCGGGGTSACHVARWDWRGDAVGLMWRPLIGGGEVAGGADMSGRRMDASGDARGRTLGFFGESHIYIGRRS